MSSLGKSSKKVTKPKKSEQISSEPGLPLWLQEESSSSEMSNSADPWLSGNAVVEEVATTSSDDAGESGAKQELPNRTERPKVKNLKRPRTSSANEQPSKPAAVEVMVEDGCSNSSNGDSCMDDATHPTGSTMPPAAPVADIAASSDSGEEVIIDDCTFSDEGDCVVLENSASTAPAAQSSSNTGPVPSTPSFPSSSSAPGDTADPSAPAESAPFGLGEVIPVDSDTVLVTTAAQFRLLLWGGYQVRVLRGAVCLHGATLTPARTEFLPVFALRVKALPPLRPAAVSEPSTDGTPAEKLPTLPKQAAAALRDATGCVLLLRRLPSRLLTLLAAQLGDTFTPRAGEEGDLVLSHTGCRLLRTAAEIRQLQLNPHVTSAAWERLLQQLATRAAGGG